ncbi:MAG: GTP-sensing pleiotropic transcriptional regulator CodY [Synergistaceae bacterium]|jgi:transcriptional pleiotropic repressor|nr:GTP-sensing pleiotropic transcriptional regulator CodY [Synergistaceae bacterium]
MTTDKAKKQLHQGEEMEDLLAKTRMVNRVIQNRLDSRSPDYPKLAKLLTDMSSANVYMINREGRILGYSWVSEYNCPTMKALLLENCMPENYVDKLNMTRESVLNHSDNGLCAYSDQPCTYSNKNVVYAPINGMGERLGTLILARFGEPFTTKDLVMAEYLSTVVGLEILNERNRNIEERGRERVVVQMAMRALSFSEVESVKHIIEDLGGLDGIVVASRVADRVGVTRSVIVNALRKLGSAGIIESRSLGMKGTYIRIINNLFLEELGIAAKR